MHMRVFINHPEKEWRQIFAILVVTIALFISGAQFSWPAQAVPILVANNQISLEESSYFTIVSQVTTVITSPLFSYFLDNNGRKMSLFLMAFFQLASWLTISCHKSIYLLYLARILNGFADAGCYIVVPAYIAEVANPRVRGSWGNCIAILGFLGSLTGNVIIFYFNLEFSAYGFSVLPGLLIILLFLIPETPYYYLMKKEDEMAVQSLKWLRGKEDVEEEFKQLKIDVGRQSSEAGGWKDVFLIQSNRKAVGIGVFLRSSQQFSGMGSFVIYGHFIFSEGGQTLQPITSIIIFLSLASIICMFGACIVDLLGRRLSMIISCVGCCLVLALESLYFYLGSKTNIDLTHFKLIPVIGMCVYVLFFSIGLGILPTLMLGELFSANVKGKCLCLMICCFALSVSASVKLFQIMMSIGGIYLAFAFFSVVCVISTMGSYFLVPNTGRKTLEEIQQSFKK